MLLFIIAGIAGLSFYIPLVFSFISGWRRLKATPNTSSLIPESVTVIIAVRNEEENIPRIHSELAVQDYPSELLEILFINDHSIDQSRNLLEQISSNDKRFRTMELKKNMQGKKAAIRQGIANARGNLIITTDADCYLPSSWITTIVTCYSDGKPKMILGPVKIAGEGLPARFQQLDMLSLMGSTAGSAGRNKSLMANAANMAFEKQVFAQANLHEQVPTGDDIFLLEHVKRLYPDNICFLNSKKAIIDTPACSFQMFLQQRVRWASKSRYLKDIDILYTGWIVAVTNGILLVTLIASILWPPLLLVYIAGLTLKSIPDYILVYKAACFFGQKKVLRLFIPLQLVYPLYASVFALLGLFLPYQWKGRKHQGSMNSDSEGWHGKI